MNLHFSGERRSVQLCPVEFSVENVLCPIQYGSYEPHVVIGHLKSGVTKELNFELYLFLNSAISG